MTNFRELELDNILESILVFIQDYTGTGLTVVFVIFAQSL